MIVSKLLEKICQYYINKYFRWFINKEFSNRTFAVFEILECKAKVEFMRSIPYMILNTLMNPASLIGILVHEGLGTIFNEENKFNKVFNKKVIINGEEYFINGWPDYYDGHKVIEFKITTHPVKEPLDKHIQQVRLYMWLTGSNEGYLIYITPRKVIEYRIDNPATDEEVIELIKNWSSPREPQECNQCIFRSLCSFSKQFERKSEEKSE